MSTRAARPRALKQRGEESKASGSGVQDENRDSANNNRAGGVPGKAFGKSGGDGDSAARLSMASEAQALEQQMLYMQQRLAKIRRRSEVAPPGDRPDDINTNNNHNTARKGSPSAAGDDSSDRPCSACTPAAKKRTTLELRAASARSFVHLPPLNSKFKVLVVGNAKCGKTSIVQQFTENTFRDDYKTTIGADFTKKLLDWGGAMGEDEKVAQQVKLQMWDIAGQDRFARLTRAYFSAAKGALVVCDVTRDGTFAAAAEWKRELDRVLTKEVAAASNKRGSRSGAGGSAGRPIKIPCILVANKADLLSDVASSFVAGAKMEQMCRQHGFSGWFVTSAKSGDNIDAAMRFLTRQMLAQRDLQRANEAGGGDLADFGGAHATQQQRGTQQQHAKRKTTQNAQQGQAQQRHQDQQQKQQQLKHHDYGGFVPYKNAGTSAKAGSSMKSSLTHSVGGSSRMRAYYQAETGGDALKTSHDPNLMYDTLPRTAANGSRLRVRGEDRKFTQQASRKKSSCC